MREALNNQKSVDVRKLYADGVRQLFGGQGRDLALSSGGGIVHRHFSDVSKLLRPVVIPHLVFVGGSVTQTVVECLFVNDIYFMAHLSLYISGKYNFIWWKLHCTE